MSAPTLAVDNVRRVFGSHGEDSVAALDGASFELAENEFATLIGTSGCGKSTLLAIIAGLDHPTSGEVLVDGAPVRGPGRDRGMVFQSYTLFPWMTIRRNVEFALHREEMPRAERTATGERFLELVGLDSFADRYPYELSGGMRQRVALARSLCYQPRLLLMDEPFGALDAQTRQLMQELLTSVWERHRLTVLFVTHDIDEAIFLSDRVLVMSARPGVIKGELSIDLPRPRRFELLTSDAFAEYRAQLLESVRAESLKSAGFAAGLLDRARTA